MSGPLSLSKVVRTGPAWYRGDFHCHTHHSDGTLTPPELAALAKREGLDFFAITDHNLTDAYALFGEASGRLIIPGIEATFPEGHFNVFGLEEPGDWLERMVEGRPWRQVRLDGHFRSTNQLMQAARDNGWMVSINHPVLKPWEWRDGATDLRHLDCLEIWNDPSWPSNVDGNPWAVQLWTDLLNAGYRLTGIGGSDFHTPTPRPEDPAGKAAERLGKPSTYVYADELSGAAILRAVKARRVWVSMGPKAEFEAHVNEQTFGIGEEAGEVSGEVDLWGEIIGAGEQVRGAVARIVRNGETLVEEPLVNGDASMEWSGRVEAGEPAWFRLEAWDGSELMLAITNPIFFGPARQPEQHSARDFFKFAA